MLIEKIAIKNYRGIKSMPEVPLFKFSSIVGKNDSGKSIVLNAIGSFLDPKSYPITESDFNNPSYPIIITCHLGGEDLRAILESKVKSKVKKTDGLEEFLSDLLFDETLIFRKKVGSAKKGFDTEEVLIRDFAEEDFSLLYLKSDDELSQLIAKHSISIPVSGTGRNSKLEKIKYIKEFCTSQGEKVVQKFIQDDFKISNIFPGVELFVSDYGLKADTSFKTNSVSELQEYFNQETADDTKKLKIVEKEIEEQMQIEAKSIKKYMHEYASSLKEVEIKPSIIWKDAIKSVDVNFQFDGDQKSIPMSHKGSGYRRLFMVARFRYLAEKNKGQNIVYLIEEPETFLHPSAQEDLLHAFRELSENNQIIVTTHSPVFAGATNKESIILCKKEDQSTYSFPTETNDNKFIWSIIEELGIKPSFNLRDKHEKILFVESKNDAKFYDIIANKLFETGLLNNEKILVLPFGGGEDIESFVNIDHFDNSGRYLYLIIDSDKHLNNESRQKARIAEFNGKEKGEGYLLQKSCIENYYHPRALERFYSIEEGTFHIFSDEANARKEIKEIIKEKNLEKKNIKEKNNMKVFETMTEDEWNEVIEEELIIFLRNLVNTTND